MAAHAPLPMREDSAAGSLRGWSWFGSFRALRHRNYRLFFLGQMVSLVGSWVQVAALMWLAYSLTGTSTWPAIIAAAQLAPACLLGAWGGVLVDRLPRRRLVIRTQTALMVLAFLLSWLVYTHTESVWHLLAVGLAIGIVNAVDYPARLTFLVEMVGKEDLVNAVGLNSITFNLARAAGPVLSASLLPIGGPELCFLVNGISFAGVLAALALMRLEPRAPAKQPRDGWLALREGFAFVSTHPVLCILLPLTAVMSLFGWPLLALLPALAKTHLAVGVEGYHQLLKALGAGALTAALIVASFGSLARRWVFIRTGVALHASALVGLSFSRTLPVALVCSALMGCSLVFFFATSQAVFQLSATDTNRGRVMGIYSIVLAGAHPLGNLLSGPSADHWGEPLVFRIQGLFILSVALLVLVFRLSRRTPRTLTTQDTSAESVTLPFPSAVRRRRAA